MRRGLLVACCAWTLLALAPGAASGKGPRSTVERGEVRYHLVPMLQFPFPALARRTESRFAVIDTRRLRLRRVLRVPGRLAFGGISADGGRLTLVERRPGGIRKRVLALAPAA